MQYYVRQVKTTRTYRHVLKELHGEIDRLQRSFPVRLRQWLESQPASVRPCLGSFVGRAILSSGGLGDDDVSEWDVFYLFEEGESEPWSHVAFFSGYGEIPAPATS